MGQEPRKATDVLLELESKVNILLDIVRAQDLNIKVLSNKLNDVMGHLKKQQAAAPKFTVEAIQAPMRSAAMPAGFTQLPAGDPERTIPVLAESKLPQAEITKGFRRTSRPETFAGDDVYLNRPGVESRMPVQLPQMPPGRQDQGQNQMVPPGRTQGEVIVPPGPPPKKGAKTPQPPMPSMGQMIPPEPPESQQFAQEPQGQIPVMQRVVDKNGKSIFLADVEITDLSTSQPVFKTRTNGTGKWMASLGIGAYRVTIGKRASMSKEKLEAVQDIQVDGTQSPFELPMLIIK